LLNSGVYNSEISILSNDINNPNVICPVSLSVEPTGIDESFTSIPDKFILYQNFPNPFNPNTNIRFGLPNACRVKLVLYNILGQKIYTIFDGSKQAGYHLVQFEGSKFASGVYYFRLETDKFVTVKKMIILK